MGGNPFDEPDAGAPAPEVVRAPDPEVVPPPDPRAIDDAAVQAKLGTSDCPALHAALKAHPAASPAVVFGALAAAERCEARAAKLADARATAQAMLSACGPDHVDRCRARVLRLWRKLAAQRPRDPKLMARAKTVSDHDACLARAERTTQGPIDPCLEAADAGYRRAHDGLQHARVKLVQARRAAQARGPSAERRLAQAAKACAAPRCARVTGRALQAYARWAAAQHRADLVLELRLRQDALAAESLPPADRRYARSARTDAACAALDALQGPGTCRALEQRTMGHLTFHDASKTEVPGELPRDRVLAVGEEFKVTLEGCLRAEAARLPVPAAGMGPSFERIGVRWSITPQGRVTQVRLDPLALEQAPVGQCLRAQFATWRYPRSHGEDAQVEQTFTVTARSR